MKIFGSQQCPGCVQLKSLMKKKGISYTFFDITDSDGLAELATYGLADELTIPIVVKGEEKLDLNTYTNELKKLHSKKEN